MALIEVNPSYFVIGGAPFKRGAYTFTITAKGRFEIISQINKDVVFRSDHFSQVEDENGNNYQDKELFKSFLEMVMFANANQKIDHAILSIFKNQNILVKEAHKTLLKFGQNTDVDTDSKETIVDFANNNETFPSEGINSIDTISSDSVLDNQMCMVEGLLYEDGVLKRITQTATLNGQNKVTLQTPLNRVDRIYNTNGTNLQGTVYVYEDTTVIMGVPQDNSKIHVLISAGFQQSRKAAFSTASNEYVLVSGVQCSVNRGSSPNVDFSLELRLKGGVFRDYITFTNSNRGASPIMFDPYLIVPPDADARATAISNANNTSVTCWMSGYLLDVVHKF